MLSFSKKMHIILDSLIEVICNADNPKLCDKIVENCELKIKIIDMENDCEFKKNN